MRPRSTRWRFDAGVIRHLARRARAFERERPPRRPSPAAPGKFANISTDVALASPWRSSTQASSRTSICRPRACARSSTSSTAGRRLTTISATAHMSRGSSPAAAQASAALAQPHAGVATIGRHRCIKSARRARRRHDQQRDCGARMGGREPPCLQHSSGQPFARSSRLRAGGDRSARAGGRSARQTWHRRGGGGRQ